MPTQGHLGRKLENSVKTWLGRNDIHGISLAGLAIRLFDEDDDTVLPRIVIKAEVEKEELPGGGIYAVKLEVSLFIDKDSTTAQVANENYWSAIRDIMDYDILAKKLSEGTDFHCYGITSRDGTTESIQDRTSVKTIRMTLACMAQDNS